MNFHAARLNMVEGQVKPNKVTDKALIDIFRSLPKEDFFPENAKSLAYSDECVEIFEGRYALSPMVFARMLQEVDIKKHEVVLDVGCLTGYSTAVMAQLAEMVIGLAQNDEIAKLAEESLQHEDYCNTVIASGDLNNGLEKQSPYDVIFINGAISEIPEALLRQLNNGGRLVCVWKEEAERSCSKAVLFLKDLEGQITKKELFDADVPFIPGFEPKKAFSF